MLELADSWVWDSWYFDDGENFHAFFLRASRALIDPERRHQRASVGHAVSRDLRTWHVLPDALVHSDGPAFDDCAIWTGSVIRDHEGGFHLFYTGIDRAGRGRVQQIGHAVSSDLISWTRTDDGPVVRADTRWYETDETHQRENWRDPWVYFDDSASTWRMLITAHAADGDERWRGTIASAVSDDLVRWQVEAPLTTHRGFRQLEVVQTLEIDGRWVAVWCMAASDVDPRWADRVGVAPVTGTWTCPAESAAGPFHLDAAEPIEVEGTYAGRIVMDRSGDPVLMAFADRRADGSFGGFLIDPVPLTLTVRGTLQPSA